MEIQRNENNSSNSGTDNVNGRNSDHSDRGASNRVLLPFSIEAILSAPHPSPLLSLEKFTRSNLPEDISATENTERAPRSLQQESRTEKEHRKPQKPKRCFSDDQVRQLERRFVLQNYISPADRDEMAHSLGLSGGQVTTWFRNRRAKYRRDLKEFKSDIQAAKIMDKADKEEFNRLCKHWEI